MTAYTPPKEFYTNFKAPPPSANANGAEHPLFPGTGGFPEQPKILKKLGDVLDASLLRVERRCSGVEKPIQLPWPVVADHFGGGLWPGLHILNSGTGVGKTQWALQAARHAAKAGVPVLYVGLELGELDLALRMLGVEADVPWSLLWTGTASAEHVQLARAAATALRALDFHFEVARPQGLAVGELRAVVEAFRKQYPETDGPGSKPLLTVVDFLQIIGDEPGDEQEVRIRIGRASYAMRDFASRLNIAVLGISSIARERYALLANLHEAAGLKWDEGPSGSPVSRQVLMPDAAVGIGKESGELEYSADSVSILAQVGETRSGREVDVVFATMKGRATGAMWSPLHFTGFVYEECADGGAAVVQAWDDATEKKKEAREQKKIEKVAAKDSARKAKVEADAASIRTYVVAHPGCSVREARVHSVSDSSARWTAAVACLGQALVQETVKTITGSQSALTILVTQQQEGTLAATSATAPAPQGANGRGVKVETIKVEDLNLA